MIKNFPNQQSLQSLQNEARNAIRENLALHKIEAINQEGVGQNFAIKDGEPRPSNIIAFAGEGADEVAKKLEPLYQQLRELNFEVMMKEGRDEDANKYFFGVVFPQEYHDNIDPLTITQAQISQAQQFLRKSIEGAPSKGSWAEKFSSKNIHTESVGKNSAEMPAFHQEEKDDWLKKIIAKGPRNNGSSFIERLRQEDEISEKMRREAELKGEGR